MKGFHIYGGGGGGGGGGEMAPTFPKLMKMWWKGGGGETKIFFLEKGDGVRQNWWVCPQIEELKV